MEVEHVIGHFGGVDAGFPEPHRASLVHLCRHDFAWYPGKAHTGQNLGFASFGEREEARVTIIVQDP